MKSKYLSINKKAYFISMDGESLVVTATPINPNKKYSEDEKGHEKK